MKRVMNSEGRVLTSGSQNRQKAYTQNKVWIEQVSSQHIAIGGYAS